MLFAGGTSISGALDRATSLLAAAPFTAPRKVIDVSGDGANNRGRPAESGARRGGVGGDRHQRPADPGAGTGSGQILPGQRHRRSGAFVITIQNYDQFAEAIERKLISEIAAMGTARRRLGQG